MSRNSTVDDIVSKKICIDKMEQKWLDYHGFTVSATPDGHYKLTDPKVHRGGRYTGGNLFCLILDAVANRKEQEANTPLKVLKPRGRKPKVIIVEEIKTDGRSAADVPVMMTSKERAEDQDVYVEPLEPPPVEPIPEIPRPVPPTETPPAKPDFLFDMAYNEGKLARSTGGLRKCRYKAQKYIDAFYHGYDGGVK